MKQLAKVIGSFICFLLVLSPVALCQMQAGSEPAQAAAVARGAIWKEITSGHAGSATVAITDSGRTVYAEGFGMADETISARAWRLQHRSAWGVARAIIDTVFFWEKDHCENSYRVELARKHLPSEYGR